MIDLHTHSSFSDGTDTPAQLAERAHAVGLSAIALTDHDTTLSHDEMRAACSRLGIEHVTGVEVSLRDNEFPQQRPDGTMGPRNVHVLAYFVPLDPGHPLQEQLDQLRHDRDTRNRALVVLLQEKGFGSLTMEYLTQLSGNVESIGRPHFARAMFELHPEIVGERTNDTWNQVFIDWLGAGGRAYISKTSMSIEQFVDSANGSGTVFSVAHPHLNYLDAVTPASVAETMPRVMASLRERGLVGVEAYYGSTTPEVRAVMVALTRKAGMIPTGGSDYHGLVRTDVALGRGKTGDLRVPDEILDELKAAR